MKDKGNPTWIGVGLVLGIAIGSAYGNVGLGVAIGLILGAVIFQQSKFLLVKKIPMLIRRKKILKGKLIFDTLHGT